MLKPFVAFVAVLTATQVHAQLALMDRLADDIEFRLDWDAYANDEASLTIELCPTSVCDQFVASKPNLEAFVHFVDVYVVFAAHYGDLRSASRGRVPPISYIAERLEQIDGKGILASACGSSLTPESISCTLRSLAESLQIEKRVVRYDQGRHEVLDADWVRTDLSVENIESNLQWFSSFDLAAPVSLGED